MSHPGLDLSSRNFCHLYKLPNGKRVDLRLYYLPGGIDEDLRPPPRPTYVEPVDRPVHIETIGQLMLLFANGVFIDIFDRWEVSPVRNKQFALSEVQQARIVAALAG